MGLKILTLPTLWHFSRKLSDFQAQALLKGLPFEFLTQKKLKSTNSPALSFEKNAALAIENLGLNAENLVCYLAVCPDLIGKETSEQLQNILEQTDSFSQTVKPYQKKEAERILKVFYRLTPTSTQQKYFIEQYQALSKEQTDFRLEAANLERLNDLFYEEDDITVLLPDWIKTNQTTLSYIDDTNTLPLSQSLAPIKTAKALIHATLASFFNEGFVFLPLNATCKTDNQSHLVITRTKLPLKIPKKERQELLCLIEKQNIKSLQSILTLKENCKFLITAPATYNSFCFALKSAKNLCQNQLGITNDFDVFLENELSNLSFSEMKSSKSKMQTQDIINAFAPTTMQQDRHKYTSKKAPSIQSDFKKITDILQKESPFHKKSTRKKLSFSRIYFVFIFMIIAYFLLKDG